MCYFFLQKNSVAGTFTSFCRFWLCFLCVRVQTGGCGGGAGLSLRPFPGRGVPRSGVMHMRPRWGRVLKGERGAWPSRNEDPKKTGSLRPFPGRGAPPVPGLCICDPFGVGRGSPVGRGFGGECLQCSPALFGGIGGGFTRF